MIRVDVKKRLGDFTLDAQFEAARGVTAIFGPSGSGKTSVINAIAGLMRPDSGAITLDEHVLFYGAQSVPVQNRRLGYVFQDARLFPHMTVAKNLTFGGRHDHDKIIDLLGLGELLARKPTGLSGGEKQRVALGRALMSNPDMLLLDEPLAALDARRKEEVLPYLVRLRDDLNMPMIYVSHAMAEVTQLANHLVIMADGRVVKHGPLGAVLADHASVAVLGARDAGAVIMANVLAHDTADQMTRLAFDGGKLSLSGQVGRIGDTIRLRIPAHDIILAGTAPSQISARNVMPVTITAIDVGTGGVSVSLRAGKTPLLARITQASARDMNLTVGANIFAIIKATAVAPTR